MSVVMIPSGASEAGGDGGDFGAAGVPEDFGFLFAAGFLGALSFGLGAGDGAAAGFGCACSSNLRHSGMCAEALQSRSLDDSGCLE